MLWYWGSSNIDGEFLSQREVDKKRIAPFSKESLRSLSRKDEKETRKAMDRLCRAEKDAMSYEEECFNNLRMAGFCPPCDCEALNPYKNPRFYLFLRQFSHSVFECSFNDRFYNLALYQPYDCREVTTNFKVALFFACQPVKDRNKDGKVVIFRPFKKEFKGIMCLESASLKFEFPSVYPPECDYYLRAKRQSAVLLHNTQGDKGTLESMKDRIMDTVTVPSSSKQGLLNSLHSEGICFCHLFPPLKACRQEQIIASGSDAPEQELEREKRRRDEYHEKKGDLNRLYDMLF